VLLYSAVESSRFDLGYQFFKRLMQCDEPCGYDYVNVVRCLACEGRTHELRQLFLQMQARGTKLDGKSRNKALAACMTGHAAGVVDMLLSSELCNEVPDVQTFNTVMKSFVDLGKYQQCLKVMKAMQAQQVVPTSATFGILLEGVANENATVLVEVCEWLRKSKIDLNTWLFLRLLKALIYNRQFEQALLLLQECRIHLQGAVPAQHYARLGVAMLRSGNEQLIESLFRSLLKSDDATTESGREAVQEIFRTCQSLGLFSIALDLQSIAAATGHTLVAMHE